MNCLPLTNRTTVTRLIRLLPLWLLVLVAPALAQTPPGTVTNRSAPERFLLILETSSAMQKRTDNVQRIVSYLFSSGLNGQLGRGDTIGVWTYSDELHAGEFPLKRWTPQSSREITIAILRFIQQQRYANKSRLAPVMAQLTNVVANSEKITVILISDGSESPVGTQFDVQIAEAFKLNAAEQRRQSMPFVTILRAAKGKFVSLKVNTPPWPFDMPAYPGELSTVAPTPTNPPPAKAESPPIAKPVVPVVISPPRPITTEATNGASLATNVPATAEVSPPPAEQPTKPPAAVVVAPAPLASNIAPAEGGQIDRQPGDLPQPTATDAKTGGKSKLIPILAGAAIVLVGLAILCLALLRRSRVEPRVSLITRSMNKDRK